MDQELLKDKLFETIMHYSRLSFLNVGQAYQRLMLFDRLLAAINEARGQGVALSMIINQMAG